MPVSGLFSVSEFARLSRTTRDTLHYYEKSDLIIPAVRGENNYRYYSIRQLALVNVIRTLQESGMTLSEIKRLKDVLTPESVDEVFSRQIVQIDKKINDWVSARKLLQTLQTVIHSVSEINVDEVTIQYLPAEAIILGDINDYSLGKNEYDALCDFYLNVNKKYPSVNLNYPVWGFFSGSRIKHGDWKWPDRFYFYNPEGYDRRPAAQYAIGYTRGRYGQSDELYRRIIQYIDLAGYEICGDACEEYPLNEVMVTDDTNYLIRIMLTVKETQS